jgi:hypothetical protein
MTAIAVMPALAAVRLTRIGEETEGLALDTMAPITE